VDRGGIIHGGVGKVSFGDEQLVENVRAFWDAVNRAKPSGAKGTYMKKGAITSTQGPGIRLDLATVPVA
jgi:large subunit ribosomal protein L1